MVPVCRPLRDHSVSPWRIMKTRGVGGIESAEETRRKGRVEEGVTLNCREGEANAIVVLEREEKCCADWYVLPVS